MTAQFFLRFEGLTPVSRRSPSAFDVSVVRSFTITPADVVPHVFWRDASSGAVQRLDAQGNDVEELR